MSKKNIDKIYGIDVAIREIVDAEALEGYRSSIQRLLNFVDFDFTKYYIYVHHVTIFETDRKRYFGKDLKLEDRVNAITLEYKVNKKQLNNMRFYNDYASFALVNGVVQIPTESRVQFIFKPEHIIGGLLETKLVTFINRAYMISRHMKIKLDVHVHPTSVMEERLKEGKADLITAIDVYFTKELQFSVPDLMENGDRQEIIREGSSFEDVRGFIAANEAAIKNILSENWNIVKKKLPGEYELMMVQVGHWLENFLPSEYELAMSIFKKITFFSHREVEAYIKMLCEEIRKMFGQDLEQVYFVGLGESASSSGVSLLYQMRKELNIRESHFPASLSDLKPAQTKAVVFIDDIIGSGKQATRYYDEHLRSTPLAYYYVSVIGFQHGIDHIKEKTGFRNVFSAKVYEEHHKAFSDNSVIFPDEESRDKLKSFAYKYGSKLYPKGPLGFDDSQALIVFYHNVPNNTLPIIWASARNEKVVGQPWYHLWERRKLSS